MRKFRDRIKEHDEYLRLNRPYTAIARLAHTQPAKIEFNKSKKNFHTNNYQEAIIRSSIDIISRNEIMHCAMI